MAFVDIFIGSVQSKYAAVAIFIAIAVVCLTVLFSKEKIPFGQKLLIAVLLFLVSLPTVLYALFQMTCLVTGSGGSALSGKTWWCGAFAWFLTVLIVLYAFLVVVMAVMSVNAERNMAAVESFYTQQKLYDHFAAQEMGDEKEEKQKMVSDALPGGGTVAEMGSDSEAFVAIQSEVPAPVAGGDMGVVGGFPQNVVAPTIEQFTSCGYPIAEEKKQ